MIRIVLRTALVLYIAFGMLGLIRHVYGHHPF